MRVWFRISLPLYFLSFLIFFPPKPGLTQQSQYPAIFNQQSDVFPVGVWLQTPKNAAAYKAIGINFYAGLWKGPTDSQLTQLQAVGMPVFADQNDIGLQEKYQDIVAGWLMPDEPDNAQRLQNGNFGPPVLPNALIRRYEEMKRRDPGRPILLNLGQGVAWDQWYGRGTRTNHPEDYEDYVKAGDILSFDIYPITHRDSGIRGRLDIVARGVDRLINWTDGSKPVWAVIEASRVSNADFQPTKDQVRNIVWLSIIHGASGIIYFVHQFTPHFVEASLLENVSLRDGIAAINLRLQSLSSVLNSRSLEGAVRVDLGASMQANSVSTIVKKENCQLYIFSGSISKFSNSTRFILTEKLKAQKVEVLDEDRTLPLEDGEFHDTFGPYATHLYRISLKDDDCP